MDEAPSRAREYFERFTAANAAEMLQALVRSETKTYEDEQLDFKHGNPREHDVDPIWSKALGAFANSQGGVVVWGIRAERHENGSANLPCGRRRDGFRLFRPLDLRRNQE